MDRELMVAVSGLQAASSPAPGLETAWCLASVPGIRIIGIDYDPLCTGLYCKEPFHFATHLPPPVNWKAFREAFSGLCEKYSISILIPCTDLDVQIFSRRSEELVELGVNSLLPPSETVKRLQKVSLSKDSMSGPFHLPKTKVINSPSDLYILKTLEYPQVVKGRLSGAFPAPSSAAARIYVEEMAGASGWPVLIQEWISGEEYSVVALANEQYDIIGGAAMKKIGITEDGATWAGVTVEEDAVKKWGIIGPFELDVLLSEECGFFLVDINFRFPSWIKVVHDAGVNLPGVLCSHLTKSKKAVLWAHSGLAFTQFTECITIPSVKWLDKQKGGSNDYKGFYRGI